MTNGNRLDYLVYGDKVYGEKEEEPEAKSVYCCEMCGKSTVLVSVPYCSQKCEKQAILLGLQ